LTRATTSARREGNVELITERHTVILDRCADGLIRPGEPTGPLGKRVRGVLRVRGGNGCGRGGDRPLDRIVQEQDDLGRWGDSLHPADPCGRQHAGVRGHFTHGRVRQAAEDP